MPGPPNWDASNNLWSYSDVRFISAPTSLLIADGYTTLLCTLPATLNLVSGRISLSQWPTGTLHPVAFILREQQPPGAASFANCLYVFLWGDRAKLLHFEEGDDTELEDDPVTDRGMEEWIHSRITWWEQIGPQCTQTLFIRVERYIADAWVQEALWEVPNNYYSNTGKARCGFRTIDFIDDTLIEAIA